MISAMSRYYPNKKTEADNLYKISVFELNKAKLLSNKINLGYAKWEKTLFNPEFVVNEKIDLANNYKYLQLSYLDQDEKITYSTPLVTTNCYFGGKRYWFICPLVINGKACEKRVGVLYKCGKYFGCRHCYNLTYRSRNKRPSEVGFLGKYLDNMIEIEKLQKTVSTLLYNGKKTRKYKKLVKLYEQNLHIAKVTGLIK